MVAKMAMLKMFYFLCIILAVILSFIDIGIYIVPVLLLLMLYLTVSTIPLSLTWGKGSYGGVLIQSIFNILFSIISYSILYFKSGLIINGKLSTIDFTTAVYFSGTTWTTVGYGDISAPKEIRLLTTIEALNSYLAMAILMALIILWIDSSLKSAQNYHQWLTSASKEDIEKATGLNIDELSEKVQKKNKSV